MKANKVMIAIDGPSGSGKSTIAKLIAQKYGLRYIDTGAMYRAFCVHALNNKADLDSDQDLMPLFKTFNLKFRNIQRLSKDLNGESRKELIHKVYLNGRDISKEIRTLDVSKNVSFVARRQIVRDRMVAIQRAKAGTCAILEGRDIGTVVLPNADVKIFLDASETERIRRRSADYKSSNLKVEKEEMALEITRRDKIDSTRKASPLMTADDALVIDSSKLSIDAVLKYVFKEIDHKLAGKSVGNLKKAKPIKQAKAGRK